MTNAAVVTRGATFVDLRQNRRTPDRQNAIVVMRFQTVAEHDLRAVHFHRRQKMAVRQLRQTFRLPADPGEIFDVAVPRLHVGITNRPIDRNSLFEVGFEIEVAPAVTLTPPRNGLAADLSPADP